MSVFKSTDDGMSWTRTRIRNDDSYGSAIVVDPTNPDRVFAGGLSYDASYSSSSHVYRSTDGGSGWSEVGTSVFGTKDYGVADLVLDPFNPNRIFVLTGTNSLVSTDGGDSWSKGGSITGGNCLAADPRVPGRLYAGGSFGVKLSTNAGASWTDFDTGIPSSAAIQDIAVDSLQYILYATSGGYGAFSLKLQTTAAESRVNDLPQTTCLKQNYPNPFNPATTLTLELAEAARVRLAVFDVMGREVALLIEGDFPAGSRNVSWNASGCSSGVYYARLSVAAKGKTFTQTVPMVFTR